MHYAENKLDYACKNVEKKSSHLYNYICSKIKQIKPRWQAYPFKLTAIIKYTAGYSI